MSELARALLSLDGARLIRAEKVGPETFVLAWFGGVQINVYAGSDDYPLQEVDVWSISDEIGEPCELDEIDDHMTTIFTEYRK